MSGMHSLISARDVVLLSCALLIASQNRFFRDCRNKGIRPIAEFNASGVPSKDTSKQGRKGGKLGPDIVA